MGERNLLRQLNSREWRLDNLYVITDKAGHEVQFKLNWAQREILHELHYLNIVLKARQIGFTTFFSLLMLDACLFNSNTRAGIIAHTQPDAQEIFKTKVKFPYENLPEVLRARIPAREDSAQTLRFENGSQLRVGTSLRSGTLQWLLVSEYGKICAKYPEKAREVNTGALNTVQTGQFICIESTAEGQEGDFYEKCQTAQAKARRGEVLTPLDFKFHFFPWWREPQYRLEPDGISIPQEYRDYFTKLEADQGIRFDLGQRAWYVKKAEQQRDDMKREYPSTPEEAFEAAVEGAYFATEMARAEREGRITKLPVTSGVFVDTFWDVGINDDMTIWLRQRVGPWHDFIGFYRFSGEGWAHYARWLHEFSVRRDITYGRHHGPHDLNNRVLGAHAERAIDLARKAGIKFENAVPRSADKRDDIHRVRGILGTCRFDIEECSEGITGLKMYRKEWDDQRGVWKDRPRHDQASHVADAFMVFAKVAEEEAYVERGPDWDDPMLTYGQDEVTGY